MAAKKYFDPRLAVPHLLCKECRVEGHGEGLESDSDPLAALLKELEMCPLQQLSLQ